PRRGLVPTHAHKRRQLLQKSLLLRLRLRRAPAAAATARVCGECVRLGRARSRGDVARQVSHACSSMTAAAPTTLPRAARRTSRCTARVSANAVAAGTHEAGSVVVSRSV